MPSKGELNIRNEYALRVPKVPRQFIDVFARDTEQGNYGLSAETVDTLFAYAQLQETLASFNDLTFSPEFLKRLPDDFREKLDQNLYPGIPLTNLEIPTTDKVLLTELLIADALTDSLSKSPVEVWVTPDIQKKLEALHCAVEIGLQHIDYSQLSLKAKHFLVGVMEYQEMQIHTIVLAHERFPEGVPAVSGFRAIFSFEEEERKERIITFNSLEDLEVQYAAAQDALNKPLRLFIGQMAQQAIAEIAVIEEEQVLDLEDRKMKKQPFNVKQEAQKTWWIWNPYQENSFDVMQTVADYLRPQYANKTLYEILGAETDDEKQEVLAAFWRRRGSRHIDLRDGSWIKNNLYLKPDGTLERHFNDDLYEVRTVNLVTGALEHYRDVAMVDQTVKWIRQEIEAMQAVREKWERNNLAETQRVECTLVRAIGEPLIVSTQEAVSGLPEWFLNALNQEAQYYRRLPMEYVPERSIDDLLFSLPSLEGQSQLRNLLKGYFVRSQNDLIRYGELLTTPEELYKVLGLDSFVGQDQVKHAYRQIVKETKAIHISSPDEFDEEEWLRMNQRFMEATKAYKALMKHQTGDTRITTLGRINSYFEET